MISSAKRRDGLFKFSRFPLIAALVLAYLVGVHGYGASESNQPISVGETQKYARSIVKGYLQTEGLNNPQDKEAKDDWRRRYWDPVQNILSALNVDEREKLTPEQLEKLIKKVADATKKDDAGESGKDNPAFKELDLIYADTIKAHFESGPKTLEETQIYIDGIKAARQEIEKHGEDASSADFVKSKDYQEADKRRLSVDEKGKFWGIVTTKPDGVALKYEFPNVDNGNVPTKYRWVPGKKVNEGKWNRESHWINLETAGKPPKYAWRDIPRSKIPRKASKPAEAGEARAEFFRENGRKFGQLMARRASVPKTLDIANEMGSAKPDKKVKEGQYYWDKKVLYDHEGKAVGYKVANMDGVFFFYGTTRPDMYGNAPNAKAREEWALYSTKKGEIKPISYYDNLELDVSKGYKRDPFGKIDKDTKDHLEQVYGNKLKIENGVAFIEGKRFTHLIRLDISQSLVNDGKEPQAFKTKKLGLGEKQVYIDVRGNRFTYNQDGKREYSGKISPTPEPPSPNTKPEAREDAQSGSSSGAKPDSADGAAKPTPDETATSGPAPDSLKEEISKWRNFLNNKYESQPDSLLETLADPRVDSVDTTLRKELLQFMVQAAQARPGDNSLILGGLEQVLRNGAKDEDILKEAAKGIYTLSPKPELVGNMPYNGLNSRLEGLLTSEDVPTAARIAVLKELMGRMKVYSDKHENILNTLRALIEDKNPEISKAAIQQLGSKGNYLANVPKQKKIRENIIKDLEKKALNSESSDFSEKNEALKTIALLLTHKDKKMIFDYVYREKVGFSPTDGQDIYPPVSEELRKGIREALAANKDIAFTATVKAARDFLPLNLSGMEKKATHDQRFNDFESEVSKSYERRIFWDAPLYYGGKLVRSVKSWFFSE